MSAGEHAYWGYAKYFLPQNSIVFNDWSSLSRTECRNLQRFQHRQRVWIRDILIEFSFYTERFFSGYAWSSSLNFVLLENVRSTSVLYKIHKMFLRFLFSQSQFDHLRYNSLTLALSQKLLVNLLDPILLSLIVWPHRNFRWLLILSIGSAYIHVKMATSYLSRYMRTTRFRHPVVVMQE